MVWARRSLTGAHGPPVGLAAESRKAQAGAESVAELLQGLFDTLQEEVALLDAAGVVIAVNAAWRASFPDAGDRRGNLGVDYLLLCGEISPDLKSESFSGGVKDVIGRRLTAFTYDFAIHGDEGRRRRARITRLTPAGSDLFVVIHDAADPQQLWFSRAQDVFAAQETERQRIAMELHDSTSQHLAALGLGVARLRRLLGAAADEVLEDMSKSIAEVMKEIRVLSFLKRPIGLQRDSLDATVRAFVKGFGSRTGLDARLTIEGELDDLPQGVEHAAFRIIQESLSNVYRHAEATVVNVTVSRDEKSLAVRVADNGRGIPGLKSGDLSEVSMGVGIAGMLTRVSQLGGKLDIDSKGEGAALSALLPLRPCAAAERRPACGDAGSDPLAEATVLGGWGEHREQRKGLARLGEEHSTEMAEVLLSAFDAALAHHHRSSTDERTEHHASQ